MVNITKKQNVISTLKLTLPAKIKENFKFK